jgi:hypothetical protein
MPLKYPSPFAIQTTDHFHVIKLAMETLLPNEDTPKQLLAKCRYVEDTLSLKKYIFMYYSSGLYTSINIENTYTKT